MGFSAERSPALVGEAVGAVKTCTSRGTTCAPYLVAPFAIQLAFRRCMEIMNAYAKDRKAFGKPINSYGQVGRNRPFPCLSADLLEEGLQSAIV